MFGNVADAWQVIGNEIRAVGQLDNTTDGIDFFGASTGVVVRGNLITANISPGIDTDAASPGC